MVLKDDDTAGVLLVVAVCVEELLDVVRTGVVLLAAAVVDDVVPIGFVDSGLQLIYFTSRVGRNCFFCLLTECSARDSASRLLTPEILQRMHSCNVILFRTSFCNFYGQAP